jgi:hypothetical protein
MAGAQDQVAMAAGHDQRDQRKRRFERRRARFKPVGVDVTFEMVDAQQRFAARIG